MVHAHESLEARLRWLWCDKLETLIGELPCWPSGKGKNADPGSVWLKEEVAVSEFFGIRQQQWVNTNGFRHTAGAQSVHRC